VSESGVESRKGAVRDRMAVARFLFPLIKPDVPISSIRLSDRVLTKAHADHPLAKRNTPSPPKIRADGKGRVPRVE
jgi:hypothetical protein